MLIITRKCGECIILPSLGMELTVLKVHARHVCLGFSAPPEVAIRREEVCRSVEADFVLADSIGSGDTGDRDEDGTVPGPR
jgi:carbon storage regulator CsrA